MTPEAQRIAIAEACGWKRAEPDMPDEYSNFIWWTPENEIARTMDMPNYTGSLDAMHEAEKVLGDVAGGWSLYTDLLEGGICAPAPQRAEALLRALGKWTDSLK